MYCTPQVGPICPPKVFQELGFAVCMTIQGIAALLLDALDLNNSLILRLTPQEQVLVKKLHQKNKIRNPYPTSFSPLSRDFMT